MSKELLINKTFDECRAVLMENGEILDFLMERGVNQTRKTQGLEVFTKEKF